jgi:hypothetical protein
MCTYWGAKTRALLTLFLSISSSISVTRVFCGIPVALLIVETCENALSGVICGSTDDAESVGDLGWKNFGDVNS